MNARPTLQFAMRLAGHLGMTLGELFVRMSSREFSMWLAMHTYYEPIGGEWEQTGTLAAAVLAPYCRRGQTPDPQDFIPVAKKKPQHRTQISETLKRMAADLGQG
jgi:hypothetical protein